MGRIIIGYQDRAAGGSLTAGSQLGTLPVANLLNTQPSQVWRTATGVTSTDVIADFTGAFEVGVVVLVNTNLTASATWRIRASVLTSTASANLIYDSGTISAGVDPLHRMAIHVLPTPVNPRYARIDVTDTSLNFIEAGRLCWFLTFRPSRNYTVGAKWDNVDHSKISLGDDGTKWIRRGAYQKGFSFTLPAVTNAEYLAHGEPIFRRSGLWQDALVITDSDSTNLGRDSVFGPLEEISGWEMAQFDRNSSSFRIRQRL